MGRVALVSQEAVGPLRGKSGSPVQHLGHGPAGSAGRFSDVAVSHLGTGLMDCSAAEFRGHNTYLQFYIHLRTAMPSLMRYPCHRKSLLPKFLLHYLNLLLFQTVELIDEFVDLSVGGIELAPYPAFVARNLRRCQLLVDVEHPPDKRDYFKKIVTRSFFDCTPYE